MRSVNPLPSDDPDALRKHPHIGVLFHRARRLLDDGVLRALAAAGFDNLRSAHDAVFSFMPATGTRLTELSRRARITKQSMGEIVRELEALGYLERARDPHDGRAQLIRYTAKGRRADEVGVLAIRNLERRWARAIGQRQMNELRATLEGITRAGLPKP